MYKLLIVDDEPMVIRGLQKQIEWQSYPLELVGTASSAEAALAILREQPVDILFTDVCIPKMDGLQLISIAKKQNPLLRSIVISSYSDFEYAKKALLLGVDNYLLKPIDQDELEKTLEKLIDNLNRGSKDVQLQKRIEPWAFKNNVLDRWVHGDISDYEFYERADMLSVNLTAHQYQICMLDIIGEESEQRKLMAIQVLIKQCQELMPPAFGSVCFLDCYNRLIVILWGHLTGTQEELAVFWKTVASFFIHRDDCPFITISSILSGLEYIASEYKILSEFQYYQWLDRIADTLFIMPIMQSFKKLGGDSVLIQFTKALADGEIKEASKVVSSWFNICDHAPFPIVKQATVPFLTMLISQIVQSGLASESIPTQATAPFSQFSTINTKEALAGWLLEMIDHVFDVMGMRQYSFHLLVQRSLNLIKMEYHSELSLKSIAADFKVSPAYLGQLFKSETGRYFNAYLAETRLQASRILLLETDLKIREILLHIGMTNQSHFNRMFKKAYGMSPLDYRHKS